MRMHDATAASVAKLDTARARRLGSMLVTDAGETRLLAGMCAGFPAGTGDGHQLVNRSDQPGPYRTSARA